MARFAVLSLACLFFPTIALTQSLPASDPQALAFAAQSITALTGGTAFSDVTLTGNATWIGGSDTATGSVTFKALGTNASRMDLNLTTGALSEIRTSAPGVPIGQWVDAVGAPHDFALHNCFTDAVWFFPALTSLSGGANRVLSYIGPATRNGTSVQHLRSYIYDGTALTQELSGMDFYLDATSLLPMAITFNAHPDGDRTTNIPAEIDFSQYQTLNGILVPSHIQKYLNQQLTLDATIFGATLNSGLTLSAFPIN